MAKIKGITQASNKVIRFNNNMGTSFVIGMDESEIASVARISRDGGEATQKFISELNAWSRDASDTLRVSLMGKSMTVAQSIKAKVKSNRYGEPIRVDFSIDRRGFYIYHGAGKGYGGLIGSKWDYRGIERTTNPKSLGRAGQGNRPEFHFFKAALDPLMGELANIVSEYMLENVVISMRLI